MNRGGAGERRLELGPNAGLIGKPRSRDALATPALVLDLDALEHNLDVMARFCKQAGMNLRPHVKTHKSIEIAKRQIERGAAGVCVATLREATVMVEAGVPGVLLTSPIVGAAKIEALCALLGRCGDLMIVADDLDQLAALEAAVASTGKTLPVLVDVDIGMRRTGVPDIAGVLALIRRLDDSQALEFAGLQAYGRVAGVARGADRARAYARELAHLRAVRDAVTRAGYTPRIVSGGGTGTFDLDARAGLLTECQCGSYALMDVEYVQAQSLTRALRPFKIALFVQCTVVSRRHRGSATIDAGSKCLSQDGPAPRPARGAPPGATYRFCGDELGSIRLARQRDALKLGSKVELAVAHCDRTVNLHDYFHCVRGEVLTAISPVDARGSL